MKASGGVNVSVEAFNVYGEEVSVVGNCHGPDLVYEVVCVLDVTGMFGGKGVEEMVYEEGDIVGCGTAIRDYGSAGRDLEGNCPTFWWFMNFWEKVECAGSRLVWSDQKVILFFADEVISI